MSIDTDSKAGEVKVNPGSVRVIVHQGLAGYIVGVTVFALSFMGAGLVVEPGFGWAAIVLLPAGLAAFGSYKLFSKIWLEYIEVTADSLMVHLRGLKMEFPMSKVAYIRNNTEWDGTGETVEIVMMDKSVVTLPERWSLHHDLKTKVPPNLLRVL